MIIKIITYISTCNDVIRYSNQLKLLLVLLCFILSYSQGCPKTWKYLEFDNLVIKHRKNLKFLANFSCKVK